ncbi:alpha/beta-hydrolase [Xylariomycetidae sp. FL0641]|nr:alpha/beta-hydrolase [Xylariomycetidae sp. FL0641]
MKAFGCSVMAALSVSVAATPMSHYLDLLSRDTATVSSTQLDQLKFYAQYAAAGYCNAEVDVGTAVTCSNNTCPDVEAAGATVVATYSGILTDTKGFVATDDTNKLIVSSVQGSKSVRNWITDFVFLQESCDFADGCLIHQGFALAWSEIQDELTAGVKAAADANPDYAIVFTGHSLGAAVSTVAAATLRQEGYAIDLYTYGCPRVGNLALVQFITDQAGAKHRVTHFDDPVPRLPPIIVDYAHTSPEYWLEEGGAGRDDYTAAQVAVCDGFFNVSCNGGTLGIDGDAHGHYLGPITGCGADGFEFKRKRDLAARKADADAVLRGRREVYSNMATSPPQDVTDETLEEMLNDWVRQDVEYVKNQQK